MDKEQAVFRRIIDSLDGNIQAQGIKVRFPAWMVIGSLEWMETPEEIKAYAYQAALVTGWTNEALINAACAVYPHIDKHTAKFTIEHLIDLVKEFPLQVEGKPKEPPKYTIVVRG
jgi:hypothetical protein